MLSIIVNGEEKRLPFGSLAYGEVVRLAFPGWDRNTKPSVTYTDGPDGDGILTPGRVVFLRPDMKFNVTYTGNG